MKKVMVFNFKTKRFEETTKEEGKELLNMIDAMNADCVNQNKKDTKDSSEKKVKEKKA